MGDIKSKSPITEMFVITVRRAFAGSGKTPFDSLFSGIMHLSKNKALSNETASQKNVNVGRNMQTLHCLCVFLASPLFVRLCLLGCVCVI